MEYINPNTGKLIRQYHAKILNTHGNHVIKCPRCKCFLTKYYTTRLRSINNTGEDVFFGIDNYFRHARQYKCMACSYTFTCCGRKNENAGKVSRVVHLIAETKRRLRKLESEIEVNYH